MEYDSVPGDYQYRLLEKRRGIQSFWHYGKKEVFLATGFIKEGDRVLDAGCGSGNLGFSVASRASHITLSDLAEPAVTFCTRLKEKLRLDNVTVKQSSLEELDFPNSSFDKVVIGDVIEHLEDPKRAMSEIRRCLKSEGEVFVTTPNYRSPWPLIERLIDLLHLTPPLKGEQHITFFHPNSLRKLLEDAGFQDVTVRTFYHVAPFLAGASWQVAQKCLEFEIRHTIPYGLLIYAIGKK